MVTYSDPRHAPLELQSEALQPSSLLCCAATPLERDTCPIFISAIDLW